MLDAEARGADDAEVLIAPIVGLRMSLPRLQLPHGVRIVRADAIEAPIDAMRSEGMGRAAWEPQYLAVAEQREGSEGAEAALRQLRELISVMRLFKGGGIGLGPYAFAPTGEERWRRIATGAPATRAGGYRLSEDEASELVELAGTLEARPDPDSALTWAVGRFEMGCERESALDGPQRPPSGPARRARGPRPGRRLAADARRGADLRRRLWTGSRPARRSRTRSSSSAR